MSDENVVPLSRRARVQNKVNAEHYGGDPTDVPTDPYLPSPKAPLAVARRLVTERYDHDDDLVLRWWRGGFWRWERSHWAEIEAEVVRSGVYQFTEHAKYLDDKGEPKDWTPNRYKVADVLDAFHAVLHTPESKSMPCWLAGGDGIPPGEIVAVTNGLLHITDRKLLAHSPRYFNQVAVPFDYEPVSPDPTRWLQFLAELWADDPSSIMALQEFFGYVLSGRTDLQKILLLIGPTRAGKGVIARVLGVLVGRGNVAGPSLASLGQNFGLQDLIGKPLAVISDARLSGNTSAVVERLLSISGEDTLTIDRKYRDPWTGKLPARFLVISNELPRFGDASGAIARRFVVLQATASFLGRENPRLTDELLEELPGILNWSLEGLDRLTTTGRFTEPASTVDAVLALQDLASPASAFVRDECVVDPKATVLVDHLFAAWKLWAEDNNQRAGSKQTFGRDLNAAVPSLRIIRPRDTPHRKRQYEGIGLQPTMRGPVDQADRDPGGPHGPEDQPLSAQVERGGAHTPRDGQQGQSPQPEDVIDTDADEVRHPDLFDERPF